MKKRILLVILMCLVCNEVLSQSMLLDFSRFDSILQNNIPSSYPILQDIREEEHEMIAFFTNQDHHILMIKASPEAIFDAYKNSDDLFDIQGYSSVYFQTDFMSTLLVQHRLLSTTFNVSLNMPDGKQKLIDILHETKLLFIAPEDIVWPTYIQAEDRIEADIISMTKRPSIPEGYIEAIEIQVIGNDKLRNSMRLMKSKHEFTEHYIQCSNGIIVPVNFSLTETDRCCMDQRHYYLNYYITHK